MKKLLFSVSLLTSGFVMCLIALKMNVLPASFYPQTNDNTRTNVSADVEGDEFYAHHVLYTELDNSSINAENEVTPSKAVTLMKDYQFAFLSDDQKKTNGSLGGNISIEDLNKLATECRTPCNRINFRLGYETAILASNRKVVVLFSTGSLSNPTGKEKIYLNALDGYCPTRCD